jgi:hypothetical protein
MINDKTTRVAGSIGIALAVAGLALPGAVSARTSSSSVSEIRALRAELARAKAETKSEIDALRTELARTRNENRAEAQQVDEKFGTIGMSAPTFAIM